MVICLDGCYIIDYYIDHEFFKKQKELDILAMQFKFMLVNDLVLFYKIVNSLSLVPIELREQFR